MGLCLHFFVLTSWLWSIGSAFYSKPLRDRRLAVRPVSRKIADIFLEFGVQEDRHDELLSRLMPLVEERSLESPYPSPSSSALPNEEVEVEVIVRRSEAGSLGIEVDSSNTVGGSSGENSDIFVGDIIVAVDGSSLGDRYVGQVLSPDQKEFSFRVRRGGSSAALALERVLTLLSSEAEKTSGAFGLAAFVGEGYSGSVSESTAGGFEALAKRVENAVSGLERLGSSNTDKIALRPDLLGYWKLVYSSDNDFVVPRGGITKQGSRPLCRLVAHWQCLTADGPNPMQTVEMIQNLNLGTHNVAALKGSWEGSDAKIIESYDRLEYGGALENTEEVKETTLCTYLGKDVRVMRDYARQSGESAPMRVYLRRSAKDAMKEVQEWLESSVPGVSAVQPRWEGYGISLDGPTPSASPSSI